MTDLVGIQITGLTSAPSLSDTTFFPVQRNGIDRAEKVNLQNLSSYLINSTLFTTFIDTSVSSKVSQHTNAVDPHGDRAYSSTLLQNHITGTDPHGDRSYSDNKLTVAIQNHTTSTDPHGDRAFTTTSIQNHSTAVDPHGDRVYTDGKTAATLVTAKAYTDSEMNLKVTTQKGVTIAPLESGKVPNQYINSDLVFSPKSSFPATGSLILLYTDTTSNDIYRWNGSTYVNLTPEVDATSLNLTTDNVGEGSNVNRKYLTQALKNSYDSKISNVINSATLDPSNNLVKEVTTEKVAVIKNIVGNSSINLLNETNSIVITDDIYSYTATTQEEESNLILNELYKEDILESLNSDFIYNLEGSINAFSYGESGESKYILDSEKINIEASLGLFGILEDIALPTEVVINSLGTIITGKSVADKQIKVYNSSFVEVSSANVLSNGTFTANLSSPIINGSPLYIYTIDGTYRSEGLKIYTPNKGTIRKASLLSVDNTGLILKGITEKDSTVVVLKEDTTQIGTTTSDTDGFFNITLSESVIEGQNLNIKTTNAYAVNDTVSYIVKISAIKAPYEIKLNNERTYIQGKAEANSTLSLLNGVTVLETITIDGTGIFNAEVSIPTNLATISVFLIKGTDEYNSELVLLPYINESTKPKGIARVASSEFKILFEKIERVNSKNKYTVNLESEPNKLLIKVNNTDNISTKWVGKFKITTTEL